MKNLSKSFPPGAQVSRRLFRDLLWAAFPARSEADLAAQAAPVLGVSERQVRNWLRLEHDAGCSAVFRVMAIAGAEAVMTLLDRVA